MSTAESMNALGDSVFCIDMSVFIKRHSVVKYGFYCKKNSTHYGKY